jgi:glutamate 5-kinase
VVEQGGQAGEVGVEGQFVKGDVVAICGPDGVEFARGLPNYTAEEVSLIRGQKTEKIASVLGYCPYDEIVHRDNMIVTKMAKGK